MRLSPMVDLMLKQMHQEAIAPFGLHPRIAIDTHDYVEAVSREALANLDKASIDG